MRRVPLLLLAPLLGLTLLTGCTDPEEPDMTDTPAPTPAVSVQQVRTQVPVLVQDAVDALAAAPADVRLLAPLEDSCDESADPDPAAPVRVTRSAWVTASAGDAAAQVTRAAGVLEGRGWARGEQPGGRVVLDAGDGYRVVLAAPDPDRVVVTAVSPCATP